MERLYLDNLEISTKAYICLRRSGIDSLVDLANMTEEQLMKIKGIGKKVYEEVAAKMKEHGISFRRADEPEQNKEDIVAKINRKRLNINNLKFSARAYDYLKRAGVDSLVDLENMTEEQLRSVKTLWKETYDEVVAKMKEYGISFKKTDKSEPNKEDVITKMHGSSKREPARINVEAEAEEVVTDNTNGQQEEIKLESMTQEQLVQKILEQQRIIAEQQSEIGRLKENKDKGAINE